MMCSGKNEVKNILEDEFSEFKRLSLGESALKTSWESTLEIQCPTSAKSCMLVTPLTKGEATLSPQNNVTGGQRMIKNYGNVVSPQQFLHTRTESNHMPITNEYFGSLQVQSPDTAPSAHSSYASMQGHIIPNYPGFDTLQPATYEGIDDMDQRRYTAAQNNFLYKDATKNSNRTDIRSSPTKKCAEPIDGYIYQVSRKRRLYPIFTFIFRNF